MLLFHVTIECSGSSTATDDGGAEGGPFLAKCWVIAEHQDAAIATITTALLDRSYVPGVVRQAIQINGGTVRANQPAQDVLMDVMESGVLIDLTPLA
jgi:hypothetical protein